MLPGLFFSMGNRAGLKFSCCDYKYFSLQIISICCISEFHILDIRKARTSEAKSDSSLCSVKNSKLLS